MAGEVSPGDATFATLADIFGLDAVSSALGEQAVDEPDAGLFGGDGSVAALVTGRARTAGDWDPAELLTVWPDDHDAAERIVLEADPPEWFGLPPGPELAAALSRADVGSASPTELIELMTAAQRLQGWTEALRVSAMAAFYRRRVEEAVAVADDAPGRVVDESREVTELSGRAVRDPLRSAAAEVGAALRLAPSTAANHLETAARLCRTLPETVRELQNRLLRTAERQTPGQLRARRSPAAYCASRRRPGTSTSRSRPACTQPRRRLRSAPGRLPQLRGDDRPRGRERLRELGVRRPLRRRTSSRTPTLRRSEAVRDHGRDCTRGAPGAPKRLTH